MGITTTGLLALPAAVIYTAPAILAHRRHLAATRKIITINLFLGWTVAGWAAALWLASRADPANGTDPAGWPGPAATPPSDGGSQGQAAGGASPRPACSPGCGCGETPVITVRHSLN
jgi:hypothetical protein